MLTNRKSLFNNNTHIFCFPKQNKLKNYLLSFFSSTKQNSWSNFVKISFGYNKKNKPAWGHTEWQTAGTFAFLELSAADTKTIFMILCLFHLPQYWLKLTKFDHQNKWSFLNFFWKSKTFWLLSWTDQLRNFFHYCSNRVGRL